MVILDDDAIVDQRMSEHEWSDPTRGSPPLLITPSQDTMLPDAPYLQVLANGNSKKRQELEGLLAEVSICAYFVRIYALVCSNIACRCKLSSGKCV
jgi:hypothetical protein